MDQLHVVTVFNFPAGVSNKFSSCILQTCAKNNLILYWNVSSRGLQNFDLLVYLLNEAVCSPTKKIVNEGRNLTFRGRNCSVWWGAKKLERTLTINIFKLLSRPAVSSSKEKHGQIGGQIHDFTQWQSLGQPRSHLTASLGWARCEMRDPGTRLTKSIHSWLLMAD